MLLTVVLMASPVVSLTYTFGTSIVNEHIDARHCEHIDACHCEQSEAIFFSVSQLLHYSFLTSRNADTFGAVKVSDTTKAS